MGCTQAQQSVNRIQIAPLGQDSESLKHFYSMQQEQQELQREYEGHNSPDGGKHDSAEKLVRQDWAKLKQTLAPKNSIQLVSCKVMQPLMTKAVGDDKDLKEKVLALFTHQTKVPLSKFHTRPQKDQVNNSEDQHQDKVSTDEVEFCLKIAKEQLPLFRKKSKIADLCAQLANTFAQIIKENPQLKNQKAQGTSSADQNTNSRNHPSTTLPWTESWYNRYSLVLLSELASLGPVFKLICQKGDPLLENAQKSQETVYYYACAMVVIRFLEGTSWGYSPMLMHQNLDKETTISLRVTYNLLLRLKQSFREDKHIGPAFSQEEDVPAVYFPEPIYQRIYSHNQLDKLICMRKSEELKSLGDIGNVSSHFQILENQIFRKTYVTAKKEIDEWLRAPSYIKSRNKVDTNQKPAATLDREDDEFVTQLQRSSTRQLGAANEATTATQQQSQSLTFDSDFINVAQYKFQHSVKTLTRDFLKQLKNPDLNIDGSLKPASDRKTSQNARNLNSLHYDQNDPFSVAKAQISKLDPPEQSLNQLVNDGKPSFEIDNSKNVMLLLGAATDTRVVVESFLQANIRMRSKYKCTVMHCCTRENKITHDAYYIVKNIIQSIVRTVPAVRNLLLLQKHNYFGELLSTKADLNKQLKLQQEAPAILVKFCKILQQVKLDFNICIFITGIENVFEMSDLQNIVYIIRSLTCNSLYFPAYLRFVLTAEKRESKAADFDLLIRMLQTKKIFEVHDQRFFDNESYSLLDFVYNYTEQLQNSARMKSQSQANNNSMMTVGSAANNSSSNHNQGGPPTSSKEQQSKLINLMIGKSHQSYRAVIDMLCKLDRVGVSMTDHQRVSFFIFHYESDHIRLLPKIEGMNSVSDDYKLTRTVLQVLTQISGPISLSLFVKICHCLVMVKDYVQKHNKFSPANLNNQNGQQFANFQSLTNDPVDLVDSKVIGVGGSGSKSKRVSTRNEGIAKPSDKVLTTMQEQGSLEETQQNNVIPKNSDHQTNDDKISEASVKADALSKAEEEESKKGSVTPRDQAKSSHISPVKDDSPIKEELKVSDHDQEFTTTLGGHNKDPNDLKPFGVEEETKSAKDNKKGDKKSVPIDEVMNYAIVQMVMGTQPDPGFVLGVTRLLVEMSEFLHFIAKEKLDLNQPVKMKSRSSDEDDDEDDQSKNNEAQKTYCGETVLQKLQQSYNDNDIYNTDRLLGEVQKKLLLVPKKRKMLKACMSVLKIQKSRYFDATIQAIALQAFKGRSPLLKSLDLQEMAAAPYETIDPYLRLYIYDHWFKSENSIKFTSFESLLTAENIFKQIVYFGSYDRLRLNLKLLFKSKNIEEKEVRGITYLMNTLHLVQQTLKYEPINYLDFCTQLRGRILGDAGARNLPDMKFDELVNLTSNSDVCYFENFHHALRENPRIDLILQFHGCQILTLKFFADKKRIMISLSNGLLLLYNTETNQVLKVYTQSHAVIDKIKIIDDRYIICAGIDTKHRIWNIENQRQVSKFEMHGYCTSQMVIYKEYLITYGYSHTLVKFNFMKKQFDCWLETSSYLTNLKLLKTNDKAQPVKLIASFADGDIVLYSVDLNVLCHINRAQQEPVLRIICLSLSEALCFYRDGQINVLSGIILEETKAGSIFSLKSDDYIDMILIKSREYFLFTIEKQKIEFFNANSFKRSDSWDYFFERDIVGCDKNKEGSKICVWDKGGYLTLFNFLKHLDNSQKQYNTPSHRRYDPVVCIDVTERLGEKNQVISCSLERDLRVWNRDTGLFLKKYDLSSFTAENVSTIKLGKSEGMLFLGSKDMNVYLIDVARGKLCVVYEGHWSRVTSIYTLPGKDILVTLSESNIKVWDLEYDECIKNMNDHSSLIVYCALSHSNEQLIVTISQSLEYKEWNYVTGDIVKQFMIDLSTVSDDTQDEQDRQRDHQQSASSDLSSNEDSDDAGSNDDLNPQGDDDILGGSAPQNNNRNRSNQNQGTTTRRKRKSRKKPQPEAKPKNLVACHVSTQGYAYLAIDSNKIVVFNLLTKDVQSVFESYQNQTVISLTSIETSKADYLIVVTRTSCVLYSLLEDGVRRMTSYLINSRKKPYRSLEENRFSYSVRFYFTSAKIIKAKEDTPAINAGDPRKPDSPSKGQPRGVGLLGSDYNTTGQAALDAISEAIFDYNQGGLRTPEIMVHDDFSNIDPTVSLRQSIGGASSVQMMAQNHAATYKNAIESLSQSPLPAHNALAISLQRSQNMWSHNQYQSQQNLIAGIKNGNGDNMSVSNMTQMYEMGAQNLSQNMTTNNGGQATILTGHHFLNDTLPPIELRKRDKYLVYLGDSRGQVHMTSLYLS